MKWAFNVTMGIEGAYFLMTIWGLVAVSNLDASCDGKKQADYMLDIVILIIVRAFRLWFVMVYCALCSPFLIYRWYKTRPRPTESPKKLIKAFCCVTQQELQKLRAMNYRHNAPPRLAPGEN